MVFSFTQRIGLIALVFCCFATASLAEEKVRLVPNRTWTPGAVRSFDVREICQPGYSKSVRKTSKKLKDKIYKKYDVEKDPKRYKIDHLIPLSIGGADTEANLWPSPLFTQPVNGYDKDRMEFRLYRMVCYEGYNIREVQRALQKNWQFAYDEYCPERDSCPSFVTYMENKGIAITRKAREAAKKKLEKGIEKTVVAEESSLYDSVISFIKRNLGFE